MKRLFFTLLFIFLISISSANAAGIVKEIFVDIPWQVQGNTIPILLLVQNKDLLHDTSIKNIDIYEANVSKRSDTSYSANWELKRHLVSIPINQVVKSDTHYNLYFPGEWYTVFWLDREGTDVAGDSYLLTDKSNNDYPILNGKTTLVAKVILEDGTVASSHNLSFSLNNEGLPKLSDWYSGDVHHHTKYSHNSVEHGNPIESLKYAGKAIGLDFVTTTDHSFDLDSNQRINLIQGVLHTLNETGKWKLLGEDIKRHSQNNDFVIVRGEEISVKSESNFRIPFLNFGSTLETNRRPNIHLLAYGIDDYIEGEGISGFGLYPLYPAENNDDTNNDGWDDEPITYLLSQVNRNISNQGGFSYAAHPIAHSQPDDFFTNRDRWDSIDDYGLIFDTDTSNDFAGLQIWNGFHNIQNLETGINEWETYLLTKNKHVSISGGTDSHGDFMGYWTDLRIGPLPTNLPQPGIPPENALGKVRTTVYCPGTFNEECILDALRNGNSFMTNGPALIFNISDAIIGETITMQPGSKPTLNIQWKSNSDFGEIERIEIWKNGAPVQPTLKPNSLSGTTTWTDTEPLLASNHYRVEAYTANDEYRAYTNPIWVHVPMSDGIDIAIINLTASNTSITEGEITHITPTITNKGNKDTSFKIIFSYNGEEKLSVNSSLKFGETKTYYNLFNFRGPATYDPAEHILEVSVLPVTK